MQNTPQSLEESPVPVADTTAFAMRPTERKLVTMDKIMEILPFLIPVMVIEFGLLGYVIWHIITHDRYRRGTRPLWLCVCILLMNFIGPFLYLIFGREES